MQDDTRAAYDAIMGWIGSNGGLYYEEVFTITVTDVDETPAFIEIGTGTSSSERPFNTNWHDSRAQILYLSKIKNKYNWEVILTEGKNREIKKIFNYFDINVTKLHRFEFGGIVLNNLPIGKYRKINNKEIKLLETLI